MKKILWLAVITVLLGGGSVWAEGVYLQAGGVGTKITSLPYVINQPGYYYFGGDLSIVLTGANSAITIDADNVTLDLMSFSLTNKNAPSFAAYGVSITGQKNVEVRNGSIINFQEALQETSASGANHRALNLRLRKNGDAIYLRGTGHLVQNCTTSNNAYGIYINGGTIVDCVACDNTTAGIRLSGAGSVLRNIANNNGTYNFYLGATDTATNIMVRQNSASGLAVNYFKPAGSTGVVMSVYNAGQ